MKETFMKRQANRIKQSILRQVKRLAKQLSLSIYKHRYRLQTLELSEMVEESHHNMVPILDDIRLPPYKGDKNCNDLDPLLLIALAVNPKIVVELGTSHGNITANLCQACKNAHVYTVNALPQKQSGKWVTHGPSTDEIGRVYKRYGYSSRVTQIFENTLDLNLLEYIDDKSVDLAIIDACHDTDYVINDFFKLLPFMSPQSMILFHDTFPSMEKHLEGSYLACMKLKQRGFDIYHIKNTWWGIWMQGYGGAKEK